MTPPPVTPPLGSAHAAFASALQPCPADVNPRPLLTLKTTVGSPGSGTTMVPVGVGVPGAGGAVGTVQPGALTSSSIVGGGGGKFPPVTKCDGTCTVPNTFEPGAAGGTTRSVVSVKQ